MGGFHFPQWIDRARPLAGVALVVVPVYVVGVVYYAGSPQTTDVGYSPVQPVPYSHALHAGELGIDCRYCHTTVEDAAFAAVPPTSVCMNCHAIIAADSPKLAAGARERGQRQSGPLGSGPRLARIMPILTIAPMLHAAWDAFRATAGSTRWSRSPRSSGSAWAGVWSAIATRSRTCGRRSSSPSMDWVPNEPQSVLGARLRQAKQHQSVHGLLDMSSIEQREL